MWNGVFYTVHNVVNGAVEPVCAINNRCHLAGTAAPSG
jgi:hypothetical protein